MCYQAIYSVLECDAVSNIYTAIRFKIPVISQLSVTYLLFQLRQFGPFGAQ